MLDIVVAVKNQLNITKEWFRRISTFTPIPYNIYLVDNSNDESVRNEFQNKTHYSRITFTSLSKLWNDGIKMGSNPFVCVINNDAYVGEGWTSLLDGFSQDPNIGCITPIESTYVGPKHIDIPIFRNEEFTNERNCDQRIALHYQKYKGWLAKFHPGEYKVWLKNNIPFTEGRSTKLPTTGCCMIFKRTVFDEIGGFDERFQIFHEDVDFHVRINEKYTLGVAVDILVYHIRGVTVNQEGMGGRIHESGDQFRQKHPFFSI